MEQLEIVKSFFNKQAFIYDLTRPYFLLYRKKAVSLLDIKKGDTVLYIGCGTGDNFKHLNKILKNTGLIVGVDISID